MGPIAFRRLSDEAWRVRLDGAERLRVGLHLGPQAIDQRRQALDIDREVAEEPSPAPGLLGREAARLTAPGGELHRAGALDREGPGVPGGLEGVHQAGGGPRLRREGAPARPEEHARPALGAQPPADGAGPEVAAVTRPPRLVGQRLLRGERLVLDEALAPPPGGRLDPLHVAGSQGGQPLSRPGLTAGASERLGAARARRTVLATGHGWSKVSAVRSQVTLRTAFTVCFAVLATAAMVLFVLETRLAFTLTIAAMMLAIALDHVVQRMEARGLRRGWAIALTTLA